MAGPGLYSCGLLPDIEAAISRATDKEAEFSDIRPVAGGSINDSHLLTLRDGRCYFLKSQQAPEHNNIFSCEFQALELLRKPGVIQVPRPVTFSDNFLVLECFQKGSPAPDWLEKMGRSLALLHQNTRSSRYGFHFDNYLGHSPQANEWRESWLEFWRQQRLERQLSLFADEAGSNDPLLQLGQALLNGLDSLLGDIDEEAVLLHGDLWSGNADADQAGEPVIFDPASYYGHREAEIGMMRLFGGFGPRCEAAYQEVWPFQEGHERRITLYRLYHELNHLNLFGSPYYRTCLATMDALLQAL